ncbi:hypothetical protein GCM10009087_06490 [Sphingomonas oligophenolica]|uniref:Rossmann fold domain-containing protein n=1 Tax=Sphingomonas oligophenolica TaxID=301154 RepID=A0ABU9XX64_9SPHN
MTIAATVRAALADIPAATFVVAEPGCGIIDIVDEMRAADGAVVMLMIESGVAGLDRALLGAAIGPLAIERAPATRIGAIDIREGAVPDHVEAAARFLAVARSTTGQVLVVAPES